MSWKICVVTATRAEYGLLKRTINTISENEDLELQLIVTGTHLSAEFGTTINEIIEDGIDIKERIDILMNGDSPGACCKTMGIASISFSDTFERLKPDFLIILGDRYELIPICSAAMLLQIPIAHISGGEVTMGAIDDNIRHCITKMSYLHFPGCEEYRKRIIQLGENPNRVFNYGDVGVENIMKLNFKSKDEVEKIIGLNLEVPTASVTFHPVTLESTQDAIEQVEELLSAIDSIENMNFVFTKANADANGKIINALIDNYVSTHLNSKVFTSLGIHNYLSLLKYCSCVIGNSSSGIVEAPSLKIPTVNIGDRQNGRLRAESIIDCKPEKNEIIEAIKKTQTTDFMDLVKRCRSPYGVGDTSKKIIETLMFFLENDLIDLKKAFYDLE